MEQPSALDAAVVVPGRPRELVARNLVRRVVDRWRRAAHAVGVVQTRVIMMAIYLVVVVPTGVFLRLSRDPLRLRPPEGSNWVPARQHERGVEAARRQF
jgi:hypothetical protein